MAKKKVQSHILKTDPAAFQASWDGMKPWEIRSEADRIFLAGDFLTLRETKYTGMEMKAGAPLSYTGRRIDAVITLVMRSPIYGLMEPWCIMSLWGMMNYEEGGKEGV